MNPSNEEIIQAIKSYQERLERYVTINNNEKVLYVLSRLRKLPIRTIHLEETGVGRTVNGLKKLGDKVGDNAKDLVSHWKYMVVQEEQAAAERAANEEDDVDSAVESAPDSSFSETENPYSENADDSHNDEPPGDDEDSSSHRLSDTNRYESDNNNTDENYTNDHHKVKDDRYKKNEKTEKDKKPDKDTSKRKRHSSSDSEVEEKTKYRNKEKSHSKRKRDNSESCDSDNYEKRSSKNRRDSSSSEGIHKKHKSKREREEKESSSKSKEKSSSERSHKQERSESKHKSDTKSNKSENDEKSSRKEKPVYKKDFHSEKESPRHESSKHETSKSCKDDKNSTKSKSHSDKNDKDKKEKEKLKNEGSSEKSHSSREKDSKEKSKHRESKEKEKDKKSRTSERDKHVSDSKHSTNSNSSSKYDKDRSASESRHSSSSSKTNKSEKKSSEKKDKTSNSKGKIVNGIDSESGASFAEALGMCEPIRSNKSSSKKKSVQNTSSPSDKAERTSEQLPSGSRSYKTEPVDTSDDNYVPELLREPKLEPININLSSLLPEITPNYKPIGFSLENQAKKLISEDEALSRVMANKNLRTKVYSGNKTLGKVDTLFDLCVRVLQDNIDALEYTGGVPYCILKPVLEKATPDQLFNMEHHNPYLIEETDELWKLHCQKEFRTKKRDELESWREMYMRCLDEREARLNAITANIKQSQEKSLPVRTAKLAYVDSVAKPPRNIARKQAKNGIVNAQKQSTSAKLSALATSGEAGKIAVPNPGSKAADRSSSSSVASSSSLNKPKKAPLMAKTLSFLKNRFRR